MRPINWRRPPPSLTQLRSMTVNFPALFPPSFFSLLLVLFAWLFYITWCLLLWGFAAGWGHRLRAVHFCVLWSEYCLLYFYVCVYIYSVCESRKRTVCVRVGGGCEGRGRTVYECVNVYVCVCVPFVSSFSPSFCFLICSLDSLERTLKHSQRERDVDITKIETQYTQRKTNTVLRRCRGRRPPTRYLVREEADRSLTWSDRWVVRCSWCLLHGRAVPLAALSAWPFQSPVQSGRCCGVSYPR